MLNLTALAHYKQYCLYECEGCSVQFWWPLKHPGTSWYEESEIYGGRVFGAGRSHIYWNHRQFLKEPSCKGRLLDIACGEGILLNAARQAGYSVTGVDFDDTAVKVARASLGLQRVYAMSLEDFISQSNDKFDVITFFEVLEHLDNPREFLLSVRRLLKAGGHIALSVPNRLRWKPMLTFAGIDFPPHHFTRWDVDCLSRFLCANGFDIITIREQSMDIETIVYAIEHKLPYGHLWHKAGKRIAQDSSDSKVESFANTFRVIAKHLFVWMMRAFRKLHRLLVMPLACTMSILLNFQGEKGSSIYVYAKLKERIT
jgi:SAM-dependent methyltransferase